MKELSSATAIEIFGFLNFCSFVFGICSTFLQILTSFSKSIKSEICCETCLIFLWSCFCSTTGINPRCLDSKIFSVFLGTTPIIGIFRFSNAERHNISCFLLPILFKIMPEILEFLWNLVNPNAVAAIDLYVLLASKTKITGDFNSVATWWVLAWFVFPPNPS